MVKFLLTLSFKIHIWTGMSWMAVVEQLLPSFHPRLLLFSKNTGGTCQISVECLSIIWPPKITKPNWRKSHTARPLIGTVEWTWPAPSPKSLVVLQLLIMLGEWLKNNFATDIRFKSIRTIRMFDDSPHLLPIAMSGFLYVHLNMEC